MSLSAALAGAAVAWPVLNRRLRWEDRNNRVAICLDFDDAQAAAIRAGLPLETLLAEAAQHGATHLALPELTLQRLLRLGALTPQAPARPLTRRPPVGHWNYVHGAPELVEYLAGEMATRLPYCEAQVLGRATLAFAGSLADLGEIGLGFDPAAAALARAQGLRLAPRPVSYAWPEPALLGRTLAQAATYGRYVAFDGPMILGHEMHLAATVAALAAHDLVYVYFAESRHQKGDWFIAKRRAPHVVLAHQLTPEAMIPLDYHAAAHNWAFLARERGIRFCYINFFRVLHATAPLEGLDYLAHVKGALEADGFVVSAEPAPPAPIPTPERQELAFSALAVAGVGAAALTSALNLPEKVAAPLTAVALGGALALPYVEARYLQGAPAQNHAPDHDHGQDHGHGHDHGHEHEHDHDHEHEHPHEHDHNHTPPDLHALYPPSYTPKLIGLAATTLTPVALWQAVQQDGIFGWLDGLILETAAGVALAAVLSGQDYQLRIEEYRSFNLDLWLPLAGVAFSLPQPAWRAASLAALAGGAMASRRLGVIDLLARFDPGHAEGHTHHISAAMRLVGDIAMQLGPQPARKWAGLSPLGFGLATRSMNGQRPLLANAAALLGTGGALAGLLSLRRPERALRQTWREMGPSLLVGVVAGLAAVG